MTKDELLELAGAALTSANGDKTEAANLLLDLAGENEELMEAFALYGHEVIRAVTESRIRVKH